MDLLIFDRYGKIITGFKGLYFGWDGTLNGKMLPADDYWFVVKRQNGKEFKGHFSLLR
jgi:gliding motility-associated-like protein